MSNPTSGTRYQISRLRFLHGAGVMMALPWLESIPVWGAETMKPDGMPAAVPKRLAVLFMANGVNPNQWWAKGGGTEPMELGPSLAPLEKVKGQLNYISGLYNKAATGVGIHPGMTGNLLSGAPLTKDQWAMLQRDNVAAEDGLAAFGIRPTPLEAVVPAYLVRYRKHGRFTPGQAAPR